MIARVILVLLVLMFGINTYFLVRCFMPANVVPPITIVAMLVFASCISKGLPQ